jgi:hypothetical protein
MNKVSMEDITGLASYEKVREGVRQRIIDLKKSRRVAIGDKVSLVFENRDTVIFQIQEMLRAERITDLDKIREEIDVYNGLLPDSGELSATLFLEIAEQSRVREELLKFLGIDEALYLKIGDRSIHARFEPGHSKEDKISAVQYVRIPLSAEERRAFVEGKEPVALVIDHPNYGASAAIDADTRKSLSLDLTT